VVLCLGQETIAPHEERRAELVSVVLEEDELEGFIEEINHLRRERETGEEECSERRREET
jgi:hypothetical protein